MDDMDGFDIPTETGFYILESDDDADKVAMVMVNDSQMAAMVLSVDELREIRDGISGFLADGKHAN